jgi:biotin carboxyl carrier protein
VIFDATVGGRSVRVEVQEHDGRYRVTVGERALSIDFQDLGRGFANLLIDACSYEVGAERLAGGTFSVQLYGATHHVELHGAARGVAAGAAQGASGPARVTAPMPGKIVRVLVERGADVQAGQGLVVMEAMKMENELRAPRAGRVKDLPVREGQTVETGALLVVVE